MDNIYNSNLEEDTVHNTNYRKVVYTGKLQLVLMNLKPQEEIGMETHEGHDQFFRIEEGIAKFIVNKQEFFLNKDDALIVPAGAEHNVINIGQGDLKLYTIYAPSEHPAGTIQENKPQQD